MRSRYRYNGAVVEKYTPTFCEVARNNLIVDPLMRLGRCVVDLIVMTIGLSQDLKERFRRVKN